MFGIYCSVSDPSLVSYPIIFDALDGPVIRAAALHTSGTAGLSGVDAYGWRHLCTSLKSASMTLSLHCYFSLLPVYFFC